MRFIDLGRLAARRLPVTFDAVVPMAIDKAKSQKEGKLKS